MKGKVLRNTETRHMHEMGENKRAQERRIDEVSVQKIRENHETIQQLTSQLQQMQFYECFWRFSRCGIKLWWKAVSRFQSTCNDSEFSCFAQPRQKGCRLVHGINQDYRKTFFGHQFSTFDSPRDYSHRIALDDVQRSREAVLEAERTKTSHTSEDRQNQGTFPMPTFATKPLTTSSTMLVELLQNYVVGQQRQQFSELQFDKLPNPRSFLVWKFRFKTQITTCSHSPSDVLMWIKDGRFLGRVKILAISSWKGFSKLRDAGREDCLCSEQDHPEFPVQEGQLQGADSPKRGPVSSRKTHRLHDLRPFSSDWRS